MSSPNKASKNSETVELHAWEQHTAAHLHREVELVSRGIDEHRRRQRRPIVGQRQAQASGRQHTGGGHSDGKGAASDVARPDRTTKGVSRGVGPSEHEIGLPEQFECAWSGKTRVGVVIRTEASKHCKSKTRMEAQEPQNPAAPTAQQPRTYVQRGTARGGQFETHVYCRSSVLL